MLSDHLRARLLLLSADERREVAQRQEALKSSLTALLTAQTSAAAVTFDRLSVETVIRSLSGDDEVADLHSELEAALAILAPQLLLSTLSLVIARRPGGTRTDAFVASRQEVALIRSFRAVEAAMLAAKERRFIELWKAAKREALEMRWPQFEPEKFRARVQTLQQYGELSSFERQCANQLLDEVTREILSNGPVSDELQPAYLAQCHAALCCNLPRPSGVRQARRRRHASKRGRQ